MSQPHEWENIKQEMIPADWTLPSLFLFRVAVTRMCVCLRTLLWMNSEVGEWVGHV